MPQPLTRICVFCGSSDGARPAYGDAACVLGRTLAARQITLVFGGSNIGLMRRLADGALSEGGRVVGVMPEQLAPRERAHRGLTELRVVASMHERKAVMADLADAFIALPGGYGTLDELCEALTWAQLGLHRKPCGLLNVEGYFDGLLALFARARADGFLYGTTSDVIVDHDADSLVDRLQSACG